MVMLRPSGSAYKIAQKVLKQQGIKTPKPSGIKKLKRKVNYLQR